MNKKKLSFQLKLTLTFSIIAFLGLLSSNLIASYLSNQTLVGSITSFMHEKIKSYESTIEVTYQDNLDREKNLMEEWGDEVINKIVFSAGNKNHLQVKNQNTGETQQVTLPLMTLKDQNLNNHELVDQLSKQTHSAVTILQYSSEVGLIRLSTSIRNEDGSRPIHTYIPKNSPVVKALLAGETYLGRAQVLGKWYMTVYKPIFKDKELMGAYFMGQVETSYDKIKSFIRADKILETGYLYVIDSKGTFISHPTLEGQTKLDLKSADGIEINKVVIEKKSGNLIYQWKLASGEISEKMAIFHYFPEMDWYIVATVPSSEIFKPVNDLKNILYLVMSLVTLVMIVSTIFFGRNVNKEVNNISQKIIHSSNELSQRSDELANASNVLTDSATKQSSSLHETVSALEEIKSMVNANLTATQNSERLSESMKNEAKEGGEILNQLVTAIENITKSNDEMNKSMDENNKELLKVIDVINSINQQTMVINDIVFQTKLLSFNASVEAARAGEHGKGFAVVAEEVGRLANMSGQAASDIRKNLEDSSNQVKQLVENSQKQVEKLLDSSRQKISEAEHITKICNKTFQGILGEVEDIYHAVHSISEASKEQAMGIENISTAMEQIDSGIQQISTVAKQGQALSSNLTEGADDLNISSNELQEFIKGQGQKAA